VGKPAHTQFAHLFTEMAFHIVVDRLAVAKKLINAANTCLFLTGTFEMAVILVSLYPLVHVQWDHT